jgi:malonate-semialdehyde dehydrogenase (acetylating)/methylmalonate-semialdehyde dehydrogenase
MTTVMHFINGKQVSNSSNRTGNVFDPALGQVIHQVSLAETKDAQAAIDAAAAAFPGWRDTSLTKRQQIMFNFREILNAKKEELAAIVTQEHGKTLPDALGEVTRGLEVVEFATAIASHLKGSYSESVSTAVDVYSIKQPLGVVGIISPFNFPAMVPMWFFPIAIAAGNTVVLKPSEKNPSAAIWMAERFKEAGLPDGVFNVLQGDKVAVDELLTNPLVQSISFVGSTPIAKYVYETGTAHGKRVQALGGAKNHMLVLPDADLDLVADSAINAGFGSAGERCMAISVVVAVEPRSNENAVATGTLLKVNVLLLPPWTCRVLNVPVAGTRVAMLYVPPTAVELTANLLNPVIDPPVVVNEVGTVVPFQMMAFVGAVPAVIARAAATPIVM